MTQLTSHYGRIGILLLSAAHSRLQIREDGSYEACGVASIKVSTLCRLPMAANVPYLQC